MKILREAVAKGRLTSWALLVVLSLTVMSAGCIGLASSSTKATTLTDSAPVVGAVSATSVTIAWTTNMASTSQVVYGLTTAYGLTTPLVATMVTSHSVTITGLTPNTLYYYMAQSRETESGSVISATGTFTTTTLSSSAAPSVSIMSPANGATVNGTITISASAAASGGATIASVQFQMDGANVGSPVTASPYNYSWNTTGVSNASHMLTAVATDSNNQSTTSAGVQVTVNNVSTTPPTVSITAPASGATVSGTVTVTASASASGGATIASVQFQVDGTNVGSADTSSPYSYSWNTTSATNASHTLTAVAKDSNGNTATSAGVKVTVNNVSTTPPTVSITAPASGATVSGTVTVTATAAASGGATIASVQFQVDGSNVGSADTTSPYSYSWNTTSATNASHTLTAVAKDSNGNTATSAGVKVTVNNVSTTPPTVSIAAPTSGSTVKGTVTVTASASASGGATIASVQFQVDGTNVGSADTTSPYSYSWNTTSATNASHTLTAVAKDSNGNTATSAGVAVTVSNTSSTPPTVSVTAPANGATVSGTTAITATATAAGSATIASVQFQVDGNNVGSPDTSSPYSYSWITTNYANGSHTIAAVATDSSSNTAVSSTINVTVSNSSSGSGSGIPTTLGWFDASGQTQEAVCPPNSSDYDFATYCSGVVRAWGGGAADTKRNDLIFWGGGHVDYDGNEVYVFNLNTLKVNRLNAPTDPPSPLCEPAYSDGSAASRHTYGSLAYIPTLDEMFAFSGYVACSNGEDKSDTWLLNLSTLASGSGNPWTQVTASVHPTAAISIAQYDPNTQLVFLWDNNDGLWSFNPTSNTYTQLNGTPTSTYSMGVLDPTRKQIVTFGNSQVQKVSIASGSSYSVVNLTGSGCSGLMSSEAPGLAYDPVLDRIVGWPNFGGTVYIYDEDTDSCTTQSYSTSAPPDSAQTGSASTTNGTYGRFQYFPALGVYALINDYNIDAHTLRLTAAGSSGSNLIISNVTATNITTTSATITWTTSESATTQVQYGTTSALGTATTESSTLVTSHTQNLSGLSPSSLYYFTVLSNDSSGDTASSGGYTFGTSASTDTTPPTVTMTAPASGSTVTGTVTVSANATDNVAVASVQFLLDGANLGAAVTASPYSYSWNSTTATNATHSLSAVATDTAGNTATATAVSVTVSNTSSSGTDANAEADYQARCSGPGVVECVDFDNSSELNGDSGPDVVKLDKTGDSVPTIDTTTYASGGGSLLFTVGASAPDPNTSGSFNIDFSSNYSVQFDSLINGDPKSLTTACGGSPCGNEFWIQWRQRFDTNMLQYFAGSQGWKQVIIGEGDTATGNAYSCSQMELTLQNSQQRGIPQMYHSCGEKLDTYDNLYTPNGTDSAGSGLYSIQNVAGGYLACEYAENQAATIPPCIGYVANQWMTFQVHVVVGTWYPGGVSSSGGPPAPFVHDSTVQLYVAQEGLPSTLVIDYHPISTSCDAEQTDITTCQGGYDLTNPSAFPTGVGSPSSMGITFAKYGKIWLLPYQTDKCSAGCPNEPAAHTWYDELIISTQQIADPKY
ncbi:MAG: Ig-like domain-containing protein [Candidatus Acidiferrales bacterium]